MCSSDLPPPPSDSEIRKEYIIRIVQGVTLAVILAVITIYFINYSENRPKNEIELIFEKGFTEYLKKIGRQ